ncbi:Rieske 2Fe-2S domain-containing protein [Halorubellus sp. JP-L1]|uniref:Rieske (2Fe-2S) protein n=1 Tax=Halorubellus sp. JP-L1 TaxID=2715753 RepID=UPI00140DE88A|nr:Rieske 2Fe-2S domain-containing protein [Halorubellus sp. JP-L1]NHN42443.1 Rieske 2Fe-2S domain-containing protein [Halorubellus sp. JP-L1]
MTEGTRVAAVEDAPVGSTHLFRVRDADGEIDEALLTRLEDGVVAYLNRCMHFRHVRIDKGDGASMRDGELVCENHAAMFDADSGVCTYGPCEGAVLDVVETTTRDGGVFLVDDDYEYVGDGPIETDDGASTSDSNVEW